MRSSSASRRAIESDMAVGELVCLASKFKRAGWLFPEMTQPMYEPLFKEISDKLGITTLNIIPHVLRLCGPSHDLRCEIRDLILIALRGRWHSDLSASRCQNMSSIGSSSGSWHLANEASHVSSPSVSLQADCCSSPFVMAVSPVPFYGRIRAGTSPHMLAVVVLNMFGV